MEFTELQIFYIGLAALLVGFTKTSVGGVGIIAVLLMAMAIPGKGSPGVLLPMLIMADIFAVIFYRRQCQWSILFRLFPLSIVGILIGYILLDIIPADMFVRLIGVIILAIVLIEIFISDSLKLQFKGKFVTTLVGIVAGISTMIANAAGPVFEIYLLRMGLNKSGFVGTRSWYFLLVNVFKVPFFADLDLITFDTLKINLLSFPFILMGAFIGYWFLKYLNLEVFRWIIRITAFAASLRLIFL